MRSALTPTAARQHGIRASLLLGLLTTLTSGAFAGEPVAVDRILTAIRSNWQDSAFSIDVQGLADDAAVTGSAVQVQYEAIPSGYLAYLTVSSHGDMQLTRVASAASDSGILPLPVQPPLGHERAFFLFSEQPLTALTGTDTTRALLGADRPHAQAVVQRIAELQTQGLIAVRRIDYMVEAPAGETQHTTRSIVRLVQDSAAAAAQVAPRIPTRIEFRFDSDRLTTVSQLDLDEFGQAILELHDPQVRLEGYADAIGTDQYDLKLSQRRAMAAQRYLVESFGLPEELFHAVGKGKLGSPTDPDTIRRNYRRVDFIFSAPPHAGP